MAGIKQRDFINLSARGIELFLGPLEACVMRAIWSNARVTKKIWHYVREHYHSPVTDDIAYTTVTQTVARVYERGLVTRVGDRNAGFVYTPVHATEDDFVTEKLTRAFNVLIDNYPRELGQLYVNYIRSVRDAK